jgi:hypothetical protein
MDIGKRVLKIDSVYTGDSARTLFDLVQAITALRDENSVLPGFATITASVAIARGQAVNISASQLRLASAASSIPAIGICIRGAAAGEKAKIILGTGYAASLSGLTAGASIYLGNAGALVFVKPGSGFIQGLGFALSTTEMFVTISQP